MSMELISVEKHDINSESGSDLYTLALLIRACRPEQRPHDLSS